MVLAGKLLRRLLFLPVRLESPACLVCWAAYNSERVVCGGGGGCDFF